MKSMSQFGRFIFVILSFAVLLLAGCGGGDSTPTGTFTASQVSGKTFEYASAGSTGTIAFKADSTWSTTIGASTFSGTWSVTNGKLVCVTTSGGNHTVTYTLLSSTSNTITTSLIEVNPSDPGNPVASTATFTYTVIDYARSANWLSVPSLLDPVRNVDVFYVYPTAYFAGPGDPVIGKIDNANMMAGAKSWFQKQATAFAAVGNLYAPYYRQADAFYTLALPTTDAVYDFIGGTPATDVTAAFDYYIKNYNNNRPFILVSHSQGSTVTALLLQNYMKANPLVYQRMIAAYAIGWSFTQDYFDRNPHLKFAQGPDDTGVIISYNTQSPSFTGRNPVVFPGAMAINPLSWTRTTTPAPASANVGSLRLFDATATAPFYQGDVMIPVQTVAGYADAQIAAINPVTSAPDPESTTSVLFCSTVDPATIKRPGPVAPGFYHIYDYPFYYGNLAANAANRVARFLNQ